MQILISLKSVKMLENVTYIKDAFSKMIRLSRLYCSSSKLCSLSLSVVYVKYVYVQLYCYLIQVLSSY